MKIKLIDANRQQLRDHLINVLGAPVSQVPENTAHATLVAKIKGMVEGDEFEVPDVAPPAAMQVQQAPAGSVVEELAVFTDKKAKPRFLTGIPTVSNGQHDPKVGLTLTKTDDLDKPAVVSVNGRTMLVPRGEPVEIPYRYYLALKNAVRTIIDQDGSGGETRRDVPAHPYSIINVPTPNQIAEWEFYLNTDKAPPADAEDTKAA